MQIKLIHLLTYINFSALHKFHLCKEHFKSKKDEQKIFQVYQYFICGFAHDFDNGICGIDSKLWFWRRLVFQILKSMERDAARCLSGCLYHYPKSKEISRKSNCQNKNNPKHPILIYRIFVLLSLLV